jgi:hypothetical protein
MTAPQDVPGLISRLDEAARTIGAGHRDDVALMREAAAALRAADETLTDEDGTCWCRPTAWAYMMSCRRAEAAESRERNLRAALRPFARWGEGFGPHGREDSWVIATTPTGKTLTMGDILDACAAYAALATADQGTE